MCTNIFIDWFVVINATFSNILSYIVAVTHSIWILTLILIKCARY